MKKSTKAIHFLIRVFNLESFIISLFIEVSPKWWNKNGFTLKEVLKYFEELNYIFYPLINEEIGDPETFVNLLGKKHHFNLFLEKN